ncbi:hypothetical protein COEREDRAFT_7047 [Coemansia reversa NRRL 1564]|uniref:DNA replication regulator Sld3 C-terminal domain-containing protein n=1 Tax=Coemansia reversa (strain ATCC 12441 / NRRL 1564) TaxID=763665 RepID=A0A2G5BFR2_COERN|nr:hypothetical protein COEREDRAFT_7047 [Coemansia reversa NRRL 1564]|eukprot:PIA17855.1 hypothetical protein COEREDRAFT_7047 [Coemansia reversa NRRL 1564]
MSTTHAYFLIDTGALDNSSDDAVLRAMTRMLVYMASKDDAFTWNYEIADMQTRHRALTTQGKRRIGERRALDMKSLNELGSTLFKQQQQHKGRRRERAMLTTLRERLMCLEADVEWGDPALMRSPTKRTTTARAWTDPTRLNETMSVRSHLYIFGEPPGTPEQVSEFVHGPGEAGADASLLENLTQMRDGIVGNGIWESYARKRVGVSWIRLTHRQKLSEMNPVDILITAVFSCCFEALGGCIMSIPELDCKRWLPFSTIYAPLDRTRTYPGWSRKFAREISAVVDCFASSSQFMQHSFMHCSTQERKTWSIEMDDAGTPQIRISEATSNTRRLWLSNSRLLRRYNLPEMVALAGEAKQSAMQKHDCVDTTEAVECVRRAPVCRWPQIVPYICAQPVLCHTENGFNLHNYGLVFARRKACSKTSEADEYFEYITIAPASGFGSSSVVAMYYMDAPTYAQISDMLDAYLEAAPVSTVSTAPAFNASWLENWTQGSKQTLVSLPNDCCAIDVGIDVTLIKEFVSEAHKSRLAVGDEQLEAADTIDEKLETSTLADVTGSDTISTLEAWYSKLYLKSIKQAQPPFGHTVVVLGLLLDSSAENSSGPDSTLNRLVCDILHNIAAIEDMFNDDLKLQASSQEKDIPNNDHSAFATMRRLAAVAITDDTTARHRWLVQECQLQILLHLLAIDRLRQRGAEGVIASEPLVESLGDLVDQLCIWASVDDMAFAVSGAVNIAANSAAEEPTCTSDLAASFMCSPAVAQFGERLGDLVEELRVQCGWIPPPVKTGLAQSSNREHNAEGKRRKGTPRKISANSKSEVIVHQGHQRAQTISGRRLARHMDELIGGARGRTRRRESAGVATGTDSGDSTSKRRMSAQLKMPLHLIRQLKKEVVSAARPTGLTRSRTLGGRNGDSSGGNSNTRRIGRNSSSTDTYNFSKDHSTIRSMAPRRQPIPEFGDLRSSPSLSGQVSEMNIVPQTPTTKRKRTEEPFSAFGGGCSNNNTLTHAAAPHSTVRTFIYDSEDSEDMLERSPLFGRVRAPIQQQHLQEHSQQQHSLGTSATTYLQGQQDSHRALKFPDNGKS